MRPTIRLLCRPDIWKRGFQYAAAVDFALQPAVLKGNPSQAVAMSELREARIFRHIGLPWYLAAVLTAFLLTVGVGAGYGAWLMLAQGKVLGAGAFCVLAVVPVIGMGWGLELIARAGAQAGRATASHDLQQFAAIVSRYEPLGVPFQGEHTYLDLALYAVGLRRRLAASRVTPLNLNTDLARRPHSEDPRRR